MPRINDTSDAFDYAGYEPALPENNLEANHATKSGGPELAEVSQGLKGSYGGKDSALPTCYYEDNHASVGGKIDKLED